MPVGLPVEAPVPCAVSPYAQAALTALKTLTTALPCEKYDGWFAWLSLNPSDPLCQVALSSSSSEGNTHFCLWLEKPEAIFSDCLLVSIFSTVPVQDPGCGQFRGAE